MMLSLLGLLVKHSIFVLLSTGMLHEEWKNYKLAIIINLINLLIGDHD